MAESPEVQRFFSCEREKIKEREGILKGEMTFGKRKQRENLKGPNPRRARTPL
jgi:hypothetical protein